MEFRRTFVGVFVLTVLALLPAAGTLCIAVCQPSPAGTAAQQHHHHNSAESLNRPVAAAGVAVSAPSHDCRAHDTTLQASIVTERSDSHPTVAALASAFPMAAADVLTIERLAHHDASSPPAKPSAIVLALRI
jgi:hypothetical protein